MSVCLSQPWTVLMITRQLDNSQTSRLARSPDPCAKMTGRIELQFGVLTGLGQCHFVLDGCPIPNRPSMTFPGEGHSRLLSILLPYIAALYLANGSRRRMVKIEHYSEVVYGYGLYKNVGTEVIQSHHSAEGQTE